ncbi:TonB-dependent receptor [Telluria mixta]|uniref:TonB-dependent receptor n=1 Tax=Telluria mixta TaxID=34071 RepID=A0ABT2C4Q0_9BURK|nr:outer membrane beta-barrel family protein [Telluria mixta]MCS0632363.1 TonB-dependent receptor [Telluria mixta]WEM94882.1 outer membrane beta-barrel family protein [Telluria mixta]
MVHFTRKRSATLVGLALAALQPALAQEAAPKAAENIKQVNVVGERQVNRIDRQVYDVKNDVNASNGSAADALNNVPSVSVDPDGTVSLRGNANVQILVDGKPSAMLQGDNKGPALQAMPAEDIDSVEVINNPGAEFGNEGGGGPILNLVMKRNRKAGGFGVVNTNLGTAGRYNSAVNGAYNTGRWGMQGGVNVRHDGRNSTGETERDRIDPVTGAVQHSSQASTSSGLNDSAGLRGQLTYNLTDVDAIEASVGAMKRTNDQSGLDHYRVFDEDGNPTSDYTRTTQRTGDNTNTMWGARWDHKGEKLGELFKMDLRVSTSDNGNDMRYANTYVVTPAGPADADSLQIVANRSRIVDYSGDYERPLDSGATFKMGYRLFDNRSDFDNRYVDDDTVVNTRLTNAFSVHERDAALYSSYQWQVNPRWAAMVGLRTEYTHMDLDQVTTGTAASNTYLNWIPSAFATYKLTDTTNLRFAYARRIRRPNAADLNPFIVYKDELNESAGNPHLKPVLTDSFEISYETKAGKLDTAVRAYYRTDRDTIRSRQTAISDTVILTTLENGGSNRSGGLEFTLSGKVTPNVTINTSGNLAYLEQQQIDLNGAETTRNATSLSVRGRINWQATPDDQLQLQLNARGRTLAGSGYNQPVSSANLSWRRSLSRTLSLVMNVTDVFSSQKMETITNTATLKETSIRRFDGRIVYVGLSWRFGGVQSSVNRERRDGPDGEGFHGGPPPGGPPPGGFGGGPGI